MAASAQTTEVAPDILFQIASGFMGAKHLFIANEIGVFEQLAGGAATLSDLAERTGIAAGGCALWLTQWWRWACWSASATATRTARWRPRT